MKGYCTMTSIGSYGRFANMLWQVGGVLGIARKNGLQPVFAPLVNNDHKDRFGSTEDIHLDKYFINPLPRTPAGIRWAERPVGWGYSDVRLGSGNWNLSGHFQSVKYFVHCLDEFKWYMKMKDEYPQNDFCAIHVRLGDYDGAYHPRLNMSYYGPAMEAMAAGTKFRVYSDDIKSAMEMFPAEHKGKKIQFVSKSDGYINEFKSMKACRHFIIGNSSYSAMAAVLGEAKDKKVIVPDPWFGPAYTNITGNDIYCPDWKVINYEQQKVTA
jgi:hypothetical protein